MKSWAVSSLQVCISIRSLASQVREKMQEEKGRRRKPG